MLRLCLAIEAETASCCRALTTISDKHPSDVAQSVLKGVLGYCVSKEAAPNEGPSAHLPGDRRKASTVQLLPDLVEFPDEDTVLLACQKSLE